jgi:uncharacterized membrane protein YozB (DUF420 family)
MLGLEVSDLPAVNATLNGIAGVWLVIGYILIQMKRPAAHKWCMISAFLVSVVFLLSYVVYHASIEGGAKPFPGSGTWRFVYYYVILIPHIVLAASVPVLAIITLRRAFRGDFERHRRIARITLPIWLYVSVTGVIVYWMLYQVDWATHVG